MKTAQTSYVPEIGGRGGFKCTAQKQAAVPDITSLARQAGAARDTGTGEILEVA